MRIWYNRIGSTTSESRDCDSEVIRIGRGAGNDIVLPSRIVADQAAILTRSGRSWEIVAVGESDVHVGDHALRQGERVHLPPDLPIKIHPFMISLQPPAVDVPKLQQQRDALDREVALWVLHAHRELLTHMDVSTGSEARRESAEYILQIEQDVEEIARVSKYLEPAAERVLTHCASQTVLGQLTSRILEHSGATSEIWDHHETWTVMQTASREFETELDQIIEVLEQELNLSAVADPSAKVARVDAQFWEAWDQMASRLFPEMRRYLALLHLKKQVKDIVFGYGPLEDLLRLPNISEIMVVDSDHLYVEKAGVLEKTGRRFVSNDVTESIIKRIVSRVGREIDKSEPLVDARLDDGSRVNAVIPPIAIKGPCLTIRKFPARRLKVDDLIAKGSFTETVSQFLRAAVISGKNVLISGGTGTGKTTLLNCLSDFIPDKERIVTVEDTAELQLQKEHVVQMEAKKANREGKGEFDIAALVRNALRMRPDRIVVGECRGKEALDMLQAMNTGHDGSMTTIHANTARDCILRLEVLVQMAADLPVESIHRQVASAIDLVVQLSRLHDGQRCVTQVTEFAAYDESLGCIATKDIFLRDIEDPAARLLPTGVLPTFMPELVEHELIDLESFYL